MGSWWDGLFAPFAPAPISGYDFGAPEPAGGWTGNGQSYGWTRHLGTDFGTPAGEQILASGDATVTYRTGLAGYGNLLDEKLQNGYEFLFGHVASGINGRASAGQPIGVTGHDVGSSKGSVTLVQILDPAGKAINPDPIIAALPQLNRAQLLSAPSTGFNPVDPLGVGSAIAGIPGTIGHGLADFFVVGEQDIAAWLGKQAVAFFVAAVVLLVLFL